MHGTTNTFLRLALLLAMHLITLLRIRADGEFHAVEINEELESIILKYWQKNPRFEQMKLHLGPAGDVLKVLNALGISSFSMRTSAVFWTIMSCSYHKCQAASC